MSLVFSKDTFVSYEEPTVNQLPSMVVTEDLPLSLEGFEHAPSTHDVSNIADAWVELLDLLLKLLDMFF